MSEQQRPITVVIIEDHELMRNVLEVSLKSYPQIATVCCGSNYTMGLDALLAHKPDIALMDIILPDGSGIDIIKEFYRIFPRPENKTKIICLTSLEEQEDIYAAFHAGAVGYCVKQSAVSGIDWLIKAIERVHEGEIWIDSKIAEAILSIAIKQSSNNKFVTIEGESEKHYAECLKENPLTPREFEVLQLLVNGLTNEQIAERLIVTVGTVKIHIRSILDKLGAENRTQAAVRALRLELVS
jgi:DNA-binding NarL/FixJ family response regulator